MRWNLLRFSLASVLAGCSLVGFDDLAAEPCIAGPDRSLESYRAGNALCAAIEASTPAAEGLTWVCREPIGDDLYCVQSSADADNDGVGDMAQGGLDCNDSDPEVFGGVEEAACDGKDNDCDGATDENLLEAVQTMRLSSAAIVDGAFSSNDEGLSFVGRGTDVLELRVNETIHPGFPQRSMRSFAATPVGAEAIFLSHTVAEGASYRLQRTDGAREPTALLMDEAIEAPAIGASPENFLAAWFSDPIAPCGAAASPLRFTTGQTRFGVDTAAPQDLPMASPVQAPVIIPVGDREFLVFAANGMNLDVHLTTTTQVVNSVSLAFADTVSGFAVALGEADSATVTLGVAAVAGCGQREIAFRTIGYDRTTGMIADSGESSMANDGSGLPSQPALQWSDLPRGFLITWLEADGRSLHLRLAGEDGFAGPSVELTDAVDAAAFPYGAAIGNRATGGLRLWTYATGSAEGLYEIALGCGIE